MQREPMRLMPLIKPMTKMLLTSLSSTSSLKLPTRLFTRIWLVTFQLLKMPVLTLAIWWIKPSFLSMSTLN